MRKEYLNLLIKDFTVFTKKVIPIKNKSNKNSPPTKNIKNTKFKKQSILSDSNPDKIQFFSGKSKPKTLF